MDSAALTRLLTVIVLKLQRYEPSEVILYEVKVEYLHISEVGPWFPGIMRFIITEPFDVEPQGWDFVDFTLKSAPIVLMTDASDYGICGYLYQTVNGVKQLIALVSKSLTETRLKWSVIQKEAYAIYYCCNYLDAILRGRKFTIMTDHKNLTYLNRASNPIMVRWNVALQF